MSEYVKEVVIEEVPDPTNPAKRKMALHKPHSKEGFYKLIAYFLFKANLVDGGVYQCKEGLAVHTGDSWYTIKVTKKKDPPELSGIVEAPQKKTVDK